MSGRPLLLALDFGGTKLSAALAAVGERRWLALERVLSPPDARASSDLDTMLAMSRAMLAQTGGALAAVGVSFGGPVDATAGLVRLSHHVPGWENFPLRERLTEALGVPVKVDNDANVAALGEWRFGAGQGCQSLLYVTVSTGVGGGWILDGHIYHGADSMAGEIGHMLIQPDGPLCACGRRGCLEALASGPAIARRARELLVADPQAGAGLRTLVKGNLTAITARHVSLAAATGDPLARQVLDEAARALGIGIGNVVTLMNPQRVVVGGGVSKAGPGYFEVVRVTARANTLPGIRVDIVPAALGDDAPLWGAVALAEEFLNKEAKMTKEV